MLLTCCEHARELENVQRFSTGAQTFLLKTCSQHLLTNVKVLLSLLILLLLLLLIHRNHLTFSSIVRAVLYNWSAASASGHCLLWTRYAQIITPVRPCSRSKHPTWYQHLQEQFYSNLYDVSKFKLNIWLFNNFSNIHLNFAALDVLVKTLTYVCLC